MPTVLALHVSEWVCFGDKPVLWIKCEMNANIYGLKITFVAINGNSTASDLMIKRQV